MTNAPRLLRWLVAGVSIALALSVIYGISLAFSGARTQWFNVGFELLVAGAAVFGVLVARGSFQRGPAMTLAMIALTAVIATGLSLVALQFAARQIVVHPFFLARFAAAAVLAGVGALLVLDRHPRSWKTCLTGAGITAIGVAAGAGALLAAVRVQISSPLLAGLGIVVLLVIGTLVLACVSIGMHLIIRAFELGHLDDATPAADSAGKPA
ncbi:MAG: hypothetical protein KIT24_11170 [Phycisphaeraceae bacterium]|nr:hypothetical protein [Phycisphaeraceae bacterium]